MEPESEWIVEFSTRAVKMVKRLQKEHPKVYAAVAALAKEIETYGPIRKNWPHFGSLHKGGRVPEDAYHCHLQRGKPTYVACWKIRGEKTIEVYYAGTHENAPY